MFKVILSDLDGVIRHYPNDHALKIETEFSLPKGILFSVAFQKSILSAVVTGKISDEEWRSHIVTEMSKSVALDQAKAAVMKWSAFPGSIDHEVLGWMKQNTLNLALLTNATSRLQTDLSALGVLNSFQHIFNTSEIGFAKPDKRAFEYALEKLNCSARDILFIDDRLENVEAATEMGFQTHHFQNPIKLKSIKPLPNSLPF